MLYRKRVGRRNIMFEILLESLREWNKKHGDRAKLQYAYFTAIIALVVLAGLVSLLNVELGRRLLALAAALGVVWLVNAVAWALLQSFVLTHLSVSSRRTTKPLAKK